MFDISQFMPHGHCYLWKPELVWLHAVSDALIFLSYALIPVVLVYFVRKRKDLPFSWIFLAFGLFIVSCGVTHLMEIRTIWVPDYWISGLVKAVTAASSIITAICLIKLMPQALALPSPEQLKVANRELAEAQAQLKEANRQLEQRVSERTRELYDANQELLRLNAVKSEFTATVSHEMRTPLSAIQEGIALVLDEQPSALAGDQRETLEVARRNVERLTRLITSVLDYQRLELKKAEFTLKPENLSEIIRESVQGFEPKAAKKGLALRAITEETLTVRCDRDAIFQVLANLLDNAIKFTDSGEISVQARKEGRGVRVEVRDTGHGIHPDDHSKLFESFSQISRGSGRKTGGTGLGLAISKQIIQAHGGEIGVESPAGSGAVFYFILPA